MNDTEFFDRIEEMALLVRTADEDSYDIHLNNLIVYINSTMTRNSIVQQEIAKARIDTLEYAKISPKFKIEERIEKLKQELKKYE